MKIEENDFRLTSCTEDSPMFDVELLYVVNKGKKNERLEFRNVAYGCSLDSALRRVVQYRISCKYNEGAISLQEYLKAFREEINKLRELCGK